MAVQLNNMLEGEFFGSFFRKGVLNYLTHLLHKCKIYSYAKKEMIE